MTIGITILKGQQMHLVLPLGHTDHVTAFAISPIQNILASADFGNQIVLWDVHTGKEQKRFQCNSVTDIHFSKNGKYLITCSFDSSVLIRSILTGKVIKKYEVGEALNKIVYCEKQNLIIASTFEGILYSINTLTDSIKKIYPAHDDRVTAISLSYDEKYFVTSSYDKTVKLWSTAPIAVIKTYQYSKQVSFVSFIPNTEDFFCCDGDNFYKYKIKSGYNPVQKIQIEDTISIYSITISPNGRYILVGSYSKFFIYDITQTNPKGVEFLNEQEGKISGILFLKDSKQFIAASDNNPNENTIYNKNYVSLVQWNINDPFSEIKFRNHTYEVTDLDFSDADKKIISATADGSIHRWNLFDGSLKSFKLHSNLIQSIFLLNNPDSIISCSNDGSIKIFNFSTMSIVKEMSPKFGPVDKLALFPGKDTAACIFWNENDLECFDLNNFEFLPFTQLKPHSGAILGLAVNNSRKVISASDDNSLKINSFDTSVETNYMSILSGRLLNSFAFSKDLKYGASGDFGHKVVIYDIENLTEQAKISTSYERSIAFSNSGTLLAMGLEEDTILIHDWQNKIDVAKLIGHTNAITFLLFSNDDNLLISASVDNTLKVWDLKESKEIATFISIDSSDYIIVLPDNYFKASKNASALLSYNLNDQNISFEQLDIKYNRPDKVLKIIGSTDTALIEAYHNAYLKRIKRLGIDTSTFTEGFSVPEADFANRDSIDYDQTTNQLKLHIVGKDSVSILDRFNVWINETPLFGVKGYSLRNRNTNNLDTTLTVILSDSINNIEASVTDVNGIESYRIPLPVNYTPTKKATTKTYFIGIGIDKFNDSGHNLSWSVTDIRNLADSLKSKYKGNITIDTLFNQDVTVDSVKVLKKALYNTTINDKVIVAYSGHGLLSDSFDYYLSTYDVNFNKPEDGGLSYDILEDLLDGIPARKKLMLLDACHSGEVDKEEMQHYRQVQARLDSNKIIKGTMLENKDSSKLGMQNSFELMQQLFVNVGRSTGATVISAAAGTQFALEKHDLKDGVFTYSILEYMKDHTSCTVTELKEYVNKRVSELTEGLQQPTARTENLNYDWRVW